MWFWCSQVNINRFSQWYWTNIVLPISSENEINFSRFMQTSNGQFSLCHLSADRIPMWLHFNVNTYPQRCILLTWIWEKIRWKCHMNFNDALKCTHTSTCEKKRTNNKHTWTRSPHQHSSGNERLLCTHKHTHTGERHTLLLVNRMLWYCIGCFLC